MRVRPDNGLGAVRSGGVVVGTAASHVCVGCSLLYAPSSQEVPLRCTVSKQIPGHEGLGCG